MIHQKLQLDFGLHELTDSSGQWTLPIYYLKGHAFINYVVPQILFTRTKLEKLHFHFQHPSTGKLYNLFTRHHPSNATKELRQTLEEIAKNCETCIEYHAISFRFRASMTSDEILFNHEIAIDLFWLDGEPVFHVVDTYTLFHNAEFLTGKTPTICGAPFSAAGKRFSSVISQRLDSTKSQDLTVRSLGFFPQRPELSYSSQASRPTTLSVSAKNIMAHYAASITR